MDAELTANPALAETTAAAIGAHQEVLARAIVDRVYRNPFWDARYGAAGRARSFDDSVHNLDQLAAVLRLGLPAEVGYYYRWLRDVLVLRGMTTRHMLDCLETMRAVLADGLPAAEAALAGNWLRVGEAALVYDHPFAQAVYAAAEPITAGAVERLAERARAADRDSSASATREQQDLGYHLSYLTDALVLGRPDLFTAYATWVTGFLVQVGASAAGLRAGLLALEAEIAAHVPPFAGEVHALIAAGVAAVDQATAGA
ncbi:MAG TPA: hypothetical protein VM536_05915 [Chloroflexia bacterium]|nr:hypothetical protein [Chloroflexia bacterium]